MSRNILRKLQLLEIITKCARTRAACCNVHTYTVRHYSNGRNLDGQYQGSGPINVGKWIELKTTGEIPQSRSSHSVSVIGRKAFVFGGENIPRTPIGSDVHFLDLDTLVWNRCHPTQGSPPIPRNAHAAGAVGTKIFVFGGRTGITFEEGNLNDLHSFDTATNTWEQVSHEGDVPDARSYHSMTSHGTKLYLFGGCGNTESGRFNDLHCFDTETSKWRKLPTKEDITVRGGCGLVVVDDSLYVVGGFTGRELNDVHRFDLVTETWSQLSFQAELPPRSVFGIAAINSTIFTIFGEIEDSVKGHEGAGTFSNECFTLDTQNASKWLNMQTEGPTPDARGWFDIGLTTKDGLPSFFVFGGNNINNTRLNDSHLLVLDKSKF